MRADSNQYNGFGKKRTPVSSFKKKQAKGSEEQSKAGNGAGVAGSQQRDRDAQKMREKQAASDAKKAAQGNNGTKFGSVFNRMA